MKTTKPIGRLMLAPILILLLSLDISHGQKLHQNASKLIDSLKSATKATQTTTTTCNANKKQDDTHQSSFSDSMLRTYIRINTMRAYHLDLHSYRPEVRFGGDPAHVDSKDGQHVARCARHLNRYHQLLSSFKNNDPMVQYDQSRQSMRLADVYGRPEAGILQGNQFWLGSYSDCLDLKLEAGDVDEHLEGSINSQYCLGVSQFPNWNPRDAKTSIKVGLCLPDTCTSSMLNENAQLFDQVEAMMKYQFGKDLPYEKIKLRQIYCLPHETSEARKLSLSARLLVASVVGLVAMSIIATVLDNINGKTPLNLRPMTRNWRTILIESFSLSRNFDKLMSIREAPQVEPQQIDQSEDSTWTFNRDTFFNVMSGLKCIGLIWIICAHTFLMGPITDRNLIFTEKLTKTYFANVIITAHLMVDTFFTLSGILASYLIFKQGIHKIKTSHWIIMTIHRYWRLTPIYLFCYWFAKSIGKSLGTGPFWDYGTAAASPRLNCENESWWWALLHLSDFKSPKEHCVPFSWFIANGIKFWCLTPLFLTLIYKSIRRGYALTFAVILANMALVARLTANSDVDMKSVIEFKPESADNMLNNGGEVYTRPYSRIAPYLIGLLAGHIIYLVDTKQLQVNLSKHVKILIWTWFTLTTIVLTFVLKIAGGIQLDDEAIPVVFTISSALHRPLWGLCTSWLVFALAHGQARPVAQFLSLRFWRILVKISFCAYLAQGEVIAQLFLGRTSNDTIHYLDMFTRPMTTCILTLIVSTFMVLFIEFPLIGIEELILPRRQKHSSIENEGEKNEANLLKANGNSTNNCNIIEKDHPKQHLCEQNSSKLKSL